MKNLNLILPIVFVLLAFQNANSLNINKEMELAKLAYANNQFNEAIKYIDKIILEKPGYEAYKLRGKCKLQLDQYFDALDNFAMAHNLKPQEAEILFYKGVCEWQLKRSRAAIESLEKCLYYNPRNFLAYSTLGSVCYELNLMKESKKHFDKALDIHPDLKTDVFNRAKTEEFSIQYKILTDLLIRKTKKEPKNYQPLFYLSLLKASWGDNWSAYVDITKSVSLEPRAFISYFYKGYIEYSIKKREQALKDLKLYSKKYSDDYTASNLINIITNELVARPEIASHGYIQ